MAALDDLASSRDQPSRLRILVVEDHEDSRELIATVIRQTGDHFIALAATGEEGLQRLRGAPFHLVVTDIGLPDFSGLELLDRAKSEGLLPGPVIVVCSASHWLRPEVLARGGRFVPKPVETSQIRDLVRAVALGAGGVTLDHRVSGYDFVRALQLDGYRLLGSSRGRSLLEKDGVELSVPQSAALAGETILKLLREVNMPSPYFVTLLERLASRDTWPDLGASHDAAGGKGRRR